MTEYISPSARIIGQVEKGEGCYLAPGVVIRSNHIEGVTLGDNAWILENSVIIGSKEMPTKIGSRTVLGHKSLVVGATIGSWCEIGNNVIIGSGAKIGNWCIFGEGTLIPEGMEIPAESVVVGRPGKIVRKLRVEDREMIERLRVNNLAENHKNLIGQDAERKVENMALIYSYKDKIPQIGEGCFLFATAEITGDVHIGENTIIGAGVKIIGDAHGPVRIGKNVQILENTVLHLLPENQLIIGDNVIIGPGAMIHGCELGEGTIIEGGAIICDYSKLGRNCLVKAGTLVKQRSTFPENSVLEGFPATIIKTLEEMQPLPSWSFIRQELNTIKKV